MSFVYAPIIKMDKNKLKKILINITLLVIAILLVRDQAKDSDLLDFRIIYEAGSLILSGKSPYTTYGPFNLPFQYFPWFALLFSPLSFFPIQIAWWIFVIFNIFALWIGIVLNILTQNVNILSIDTLSILASGLVMNLLIFRVGQISIILFVIASLIIWFLSKEEYHLAGLLLPFLLAKPQLLIIFVPTVFLKGGKKTILFAGVSFLTICGFSSLFLQDWHKQLAEIIIIGQQRMDTLVWNFTTFPGLLGLKENLRLLNYFSTLMLLPPSLIAIWKLRHVESSTFLAFSLVLSLLVAPYSFAYDLSFGIPAVIMLCDKWKKASVTILCFIAILPPLFKYSSGSYLVTVFVTVLSGFILHQRTLKLQKANNNFDSLSQAHPS